MSPGREIVKAGKNDSSVRTIHWDMRVWIDLYLVLLYNVFLEVTPPHQIFLELHVIDY